MRPIAVFILVTLEGALRLNAVSFNAPRAYLVPGATAVAAVDLNGDTRPDLVVACSGSQFISILLNNGDGTFQPPVNYATGGTAVAVATGDFNGDGKVDLAVANQAFNLSLIHI